MPPYLYMIMGGITQNGYKPVGVKSDAEKEVWMECQLEAGEYLIYTNVFANFVREDKDISISAYGVDHATFTVATDMQ